MFIKIQINKIKWRQVYSTVLGYKLKSKLEKYVEDVNNDYKQNSAEPMWSNFETMCRSNAAAVL